MNNPLHEENSLHSGSKVLLFNKEYIAEFVYGGIDGAITTFAVVAGATGANADLKWVLIFGFANLIADGFSMSVGSFFSAKAEKDNFERHKAIEYYEIENLRELEVQEIRDIYAAKGFKGELLEQVVEVITADKDVWVDTMMKEELEMAKDFKTPLKTASATFIAFNFIGFIPLMIYVIAYFVEFTDGQMFLGSCIMTGLALMVIGNLKAVVTETSRIRGILETVFLGGIAATLAYFAGDVLARFIL